MRKLLSMMLAGVLVLGVGFSAAGIMSIAGSGDLFVALGSDGGSDGGTGSDGAIDSDGEAAKDISGATVTIADVTYTGKALTPAAKVVLDGKTLTANTDYTVVYSDNKNAGTASAQVSGKGSYTGTVDAEFTIKQAANTMTAKGKTYTVKYTKLKKKNQAVARKYVCSISKNNGKVTYKKTSGNKNITVAASTGKVTVKKGLKKGTYSIKMKVRAAGDANHKAGAKNITFKIKVK